MCVCCAGLTVLQSDNPWTLHATQNPQCLFMHGQPWNNVPLSLSTSASFAKTVMGPVAVMVPVPDTDKVIAASADGKIVRFAEVCVCARVCVVGCV